MDTQTELPNSEIALRVRGISKTFPGVLAVNDVDLDVATGSVHAILGHNGCGKSTLVKALAGVHAPDPGGSVLINGQALDVGNPRDAELKGLRFVHQDLGLIPELSVADNIGFVVGYERGATGGISWKRQSDSSRELLERFGFDLDPMRPLAEASPSQATAVAIVRAVAGWQRGRGVVVLDEPTASLPGREVDELFRLIREIRDSGTAVILVSHRLDEVMEIADHATIMRGGEILWNGALADVSTRSLVGMIADSEQEETGEADSGIFESGREHADAGGGVALRVSGLSATYLNDISFQVRSGEIVGVAGLLGSGREEIPYVVAGATTEGVTGVVEIDGTQVEGLGIRKAQELGVAFVPADRAKEGIIEEFSTRENVSLAALDRISNRGFLSPRKEKEFARTWLEAVSADAGASELPISTLSGGNQQKAVLARWLAMDPKLLVLAEPTAGVDVGARQVIYDEIENCARQGMAVLMSSSDVEDLLAVCDRVIVLRDAEIVAELSGQTMDKTTILGSMEGIPNGE